MTTVVTSGSGHIDIDALACAEAYGDYLNKRGEKAEVIFSPSPNATVPPMLRRLPVLWKSASDCAVPADVAGFAVMDVSNPEFFDPIVRHDKIVAVFDHHYGFEDLWKNRRGVLAIIEPIGACATIVWERVAATGHHDALNPASYELLLAAIVSNTLNFRSRLADERDRKAYGEILPRANVSGDWARRYFEETSGSIMADPAGALLRDEKYLALPGGKLWIGQIEVWDAGGIISGAGMNAIISIFANGRRGFANIVSISEGVNYMIADSVITRDMLGGIISGDALGDNCLRTKELWLRKELVRDISRFYAPCGR